MSDITASSPEVLPFRYWWGLLGCALIIGFMFVAGPYSEGLSLEPDRGNMWYFWQLSEPTVWTRLAAWGPFTLHWLGMWYLIS